MGSEEVRRYMQQHSIPQLFEGLMSGLIYNKPDSPIDFLEGAIGRMRANPGLVLKWDTFIDVSRITGNPPYPLTNANVPVASKPTTASTNAPRRSSAASSKAGSTGRTSRASSKKPSRGSGGPSRRASPSSGLCDAEDKETVDVDGVPIRRNRSARGSAGSAGSGGNKAARPAIDQSDPHQSISPYEQQRHHESHPHSHSSSPKATKKTSGSQASSSTHLNRSRSNHSHSSLHQRSPSVSKAAAHAKIPDDAPIILFMGGPGGGKTRYAARIRAAMEEQGLVHICMPDMIRQAIAKYKDTYPEWKEAEQKYQRGELIPNNLALQLVKAEMGRHPHAKVFFLEGFPREARQVEEFEKHVRPVNLAMILDYDEETLRKHMHNRGLIDEVIDRRISEFKMKTLPSAKYFDDQRLLHLIPGEKAEDAIYGRMIKLVTRAMAAGVHVQHDVITPTTGPVTPAQTSPAPQGAVTAVENEEKVGNGSVSGLVSPVEAKLASPPTSTAPAVQLVAENTNETVSSPVPLSNSRLEELRRSESSPKKDLPKPQTASGRVSARSTTPASKPPLHPTASSPQLISAATPVVIEAQAVAMANGPLSPSARSIARTGDDSRTTTPAARPPINEPRRVPLSRADTVTGRVGTAASGSTRGVIGMVPVGTPFRRPSTAGNNGAVSVTAQTPPSTRAGSKISESSPASTVVDRPPMAPPTASSNRVTESRRGSNNSSVAMSRPPTRPRAPPDSRRASQTDLAKRAPTYPTDRFPRGLPCDAPVILVIGAPGSEKAAYAQRVAKKYDGFTLLSMGDLLRRRVMQEGGEDELWARIGKKMDGGELIPMRICRDLLYTALHEQGIKSWGYVMEGYPRTVPQAEELEAQLGRLDVAVLIDCTEQQCRDTLKARYASAKEQGAERADDEPEVVNARLAAFKANTLPMLKHLDDRGALKVVRGVAWRSSDGEGRIAVAQAPALSEPPSSTVPCPPSTDGMMSRIRSAVDTVPATASPPVIVAASLGAGLGGSTGGRGDGLSNGTAGTNPPSQSGDGDGTNSIHVRPLKASRIDGEGTAGDSADKVFDEITTVIDNAVFIDVDGGDGRSLASSKANSVVNGEE